MLCVGFVILCDVRLYTAVKQLNVAECDTFTPYSPLQSASTRSHRAYVARFHVTWAAMTEPSQTASLSFHNIGSDGLIRFAIVNHRGTSSAPRSVYGPVRLARRPVWERANTRTSVRTSTTMPAPARHCPTNDDEIGSNELTQRSSSRSASLSSESESDPRPGPGTLSTVLPPDLGRPVQTTSPSSSSLASGLGSGPTSTSTCKRRRSDQTVPDEEGASSQAATQEVVDRSVSQLFGEPVGSVSRHESTLRSTSTAVLKRVATGGPTADAAAAVRAPLDRTHCQWQQNHLFLMSNPSTPINGGFQPFTQLTPTLQSVCSDEGMPCYGDLCSRHAKRLLGLEVKASTERSAGLGLYTMWARRAGEVICEYKGNIRLVLSSTLYHAKYMVNLPERVPGHTDPTTEYVIDASRSTDGFGRFINDLSHGEKPKPNNCLFRRGGECRPPRDRYRYYIEASAAIPAYTELSISYGAAYWRE